MTSEACQIREEADRIAALERRGYYEFIRDPIVQLKIWWRAFYHVVGISEEE